MAVTDEIFREAAREAISNQRRKQRITGKTTIGLKLQGTGGGGTQETETPKETNETPPPIKKREDQEKLTGIVNSEGRPLYAPSLSPVPFVVKCIKAPKEGVSGVGP